MSKVVLLATFFSVTPALIIVSILFFLSVVYHKNLNGNGYFTSNAVAYAALPTSEGTFAEEIHAQDARVEAVRQFLALHKSPLEPYAEQIIDAADRYDIDYRLIPAIAMQESNLCKKIIVSNAENNCWGYGIHGKNRWSFDNYGEGIEIVSKALAKYKESGLVTPEEIMSRYTPSSPNGAWAASVTSFMSQM